ncbi:D-2-hydroxyacid dehydrogenase [Paenalkalicoccus suaedae]|uniref:D-2-hydroxyacid dehydrogenase n=1 Tax=Paenalkalicoccus suaedae TaxID=2592382 RepID=A0A859FBQ7_9BACI|nr:D-2-hydroxyacid dehydrogenase [Paenalkalicoccus suaedae]QKS70151.1 D-2-hydroxyacid dehydrogenase [Paenalkalicoccus suaedae]
MSTILILRDLSKELENKIKQALPNWTVILSKEKSDWEPHLKDAEIIGGWHRDLPSMLEQAPNLTWIQTWSAGVDSLPLDDLDRRGITVTSANGVHAYPISETIVGMMLSLTRKLHVYGRQQEQKEWHHANLGMEMHEKTVAIVGLGAIGKETAKLCKAFSMKTIGVKRTVTDVDYVDEVLPFDDLMNKLPECDYVINTLPHTKQTEALFSKQVFEKMKESSYFINIGRGETVDEEAMVDALRNKKIAGAGLDVFQEEPLKKESDLWELDNVIITPHTSGSTDVYYTRLVDSIFVPNLEAYVKDQKPTINVVDVKNGY